MHKIYQIDPKNYQKLTRKKYILSIAHRKSFESELQFERHFPSKPNHIFLNSMKLLRRCFHL